MSENTPFSSWVLAYVAAVAFGFLVLGGLTFVLARRRGEADPLWWGVFGGALPLITLAFLLVRRPKAPGLGIRRRRPLAWLGVAALLLALTLPAYAEYVGRKALIFVDEQRELSRWWELAIRISNFQLRYGFLLYALLAGTAAALVAWQPPLRAKDTGPPNPPLQPPGSASG